jgi:AcrR family transcriptional regulator
MPTQTFTNLPAEKRIRIIQAAKEEFSQYSFYDTSINRIIKEAQIPRGSFYRYFENKEDLFLYLLNEYKSDLINQINSKINDRVDLFSLHFILFDYITKKAMDPAHSKFLVNVFTRTDIKLAENLMSFTDVREMEEQHERLLNLVTDTHLLKGDSKEDLFQVIAILRAITFNQIILALNDLSTVGQKRTDMERQFHFVKYGVLK